ncbi:hypothetical protein BS78_08G145500 [Paspalum vaginatum]|nr:hypothetical protein BS78_08G145500 [Paspalum vaginatum]KAJ1266364.1 hypothetical protein BS78_08G145500 [Paspalum vaginatum]
MESPGPLPALTDDLLEEVFVRIGSPADLIRASTACVAFRRLIADPSFLRRYRSLHPPLLLGLLSAYGDPLEVTEAPHPSAALAGAVARAADFDFRAYKPSGLGGSYVCDVRDGRVLMCFPEDDDGEEIFCQLAVCDPLARRRLLMPPLPDDLLASVQAQKRDLLYLGAFLVPSGDDEDANFFRVIACTTFTEMVVAFIFSSDTGHWSAGPSMSCDARTLSIPHDDPPSYAYGCFYWKVDIENKLFKLDTSSMEFSFVDLPPGHDKSRVVIVEAGEGRLGMFSEISDFTSLYYATIRKIGAQRFDQLIMDRVIPLPADYYFRILGSYEGHIFMIGYCWTDDTCFALEVKTLKIERVCRRFRGGAVYPYFGFPASISEGRI